MKALSLFSGMGGDTLGMTRAGLEVAWYSELKEYIQRTHDLNFPDSHFLGGDIASVTQEQLETVDADVIFAGFPCQGFSHAGKKLPEDPRNTLFREFVRCTKVIRPKVVIGENVKGLLTRKTADSQKYIDVITTEFENLGYVITYRVCKAHKYGVPQKRERLIIIGVREDVAGDFNLSFPEESAESPNLEDIVKFDTTGALRVPEALFDDIPDECVLTNMSNTDDTQTPHPYLLAKANAVGDKLSYAGKTHENLFSFGKRISPIHCEIVDIRNPSKTVICTFEHQPRLFAPLRNAKGCFLRALLPEELKQIQGFPKDYIVSGTTKEQIIQIGNAVPPPLIEKICRHIMGL